MTGPCFLSSNGTYKRTGNFWGFRLSSVIRLPLAAKHAGADKHIGLRGPDERGFKLAADVYFSVQNERL